MSYPRLPFCLARFLNDATSFGCFEENIISFTSVVKQKPEMSDEVEIFLKYVLDRSQEINGSIHQENRGDCEYFLSELLLHVDLLGKTVHFLHEIGNMSSLDNQDKAKWKELERVYSEVEREFVCLYNHRYYQQSQKVERKRPGRPSYNIPKDVLVELRGFNFSWCKISQMFGVSRWTVMRRVQEYGLSDLQEFSNISDNRIDDIIRDYMSRHGSTTGEPLMSGYFHCLGLHVQRSRIRAAINRVDPRNTALRWGALVSRRKYYVPWPNSLWHIDGHHSLIRWRFVVHGCCDGKSRKIMFLKCSTNNLAETVLELFKDAIKNNRGLWPSRIRVDRGVENVLICDEMVTHWGEGRHSFIAGSSTNNQRIERLWRDVFRCVCHFFYFTFYAMEQSGILDVENPIHIFSLHLVFAPRINTALKEFATMFNNHRLSTEHGWTPNQIWLNGIMDDNNPLSSSDGVDTYVVNEFYGEDPGGPRPHLDDDGVQVAPVELAHSKEVSDFVLQYVNVNRPSNQAGIDIYSEVLTLVVQKLEEYL